MAFLYMEKGEDRQFTIVVSVDLTDGTLRWTAKEFRSEDAAIVLQKVSTDTDEIEIAAGTAGAATIKIDRADTVGLAPGRLFWDLWLTNADGSQQVADGRLYIEPTITTTVP